MKSQPCKAEPRNTLDSFSAAVRAGHANTTAGTGPAGRQGGGLNPRKGARQTTKRTPDITRVFLPHNRKRSIDLKRQKRRGKKGIRLDTFCGWPKFLSLPRKETPGLGVSLGTSFHILSDRGTKYSSMTRFRHLPIVQTVALFGN